MRLPILICAGLALASCADVIEAHGPTTRIYTDPEVAQCALKGSGFSRVVQTPIRVILPKEASPITVTCTADGYLPSVHHLATDVNSSIKSNLLMGSSIGLAVDILTGAAEQYPTSVRVHLEPEAFPTETARDDWYGRYRHSVERKWYDVIDGLRVTCEREREAANDCLTAMADAQASRQRDLAALEDRRSRATLRMENQARSLAAPARPSRP